MALGNRFDVAVDAHHERKGRIEQYMSMLQRIIDGESVDLQTMDWNDPLWVEGVTRMLREAGKWRADARKLAVVKEVFGGAK